MDISSLRERKMGSELTVSELNAYVKRIFDTDRTLNAVTVKGEISNFTYHRTGHLYFSLKDEEGQIKAVMFRSAAASLKFLPENGMKVIVRCSVSVYTQTGTYQLYVNSMQPDGIGELYLAYEQLKSKLDAEGLFSPAHKKPIPRFPSKIGVITSPTGAAVRDIINVTSRRYPLADIYLYPSLVQGDGAEANLIKALDYFSKSSLVDVIIIGRGGGSIEDLWAFNGEGLARKIFETEIPIISAVGHETDFTICDFVADLRAPTPSAAAELSVPDKRDLLVFFGVAYDRCSEALKRKTERLSERLESIVNSAVLTNPELSFMDKEDKIENFKRNINESISKYLTLSDSILKIIAGKLNALSPLATLSRGYSVVYSDKKLIKSVKKIGIGDNVTIRLLDGELNAMVTEKKDLKK